MSSLFGSNQMARRIYYIGLLSVKTFFLLLKNSIKKGKKKEVRHISNLVEIDLNHHFQICIYKITIISFIPY